MTGTYVWHAPDGYIPERLGAGRDSHESICVTNDSDEDVELLLTAFFSDDAPTRVEGVRVVAGRNRHIRTDSQELSGLGLHPGVPYGLRIECSARVSVQYSRLDESTPHSTLMTAVLWPVRHGDPAQRCERTPCASR